MSKRKLKKFWKSTWQTKKFVIYYVGCLRERVAKETDFENWTTKDERKQSKERRKDEPEKTRWIPKKKYRNVKHNINDTQGKK